jgi:hypothetical protein
MAGYHVAKGAVLHSNKRKEQRHATQFPLHFITPSSKLTDTALRDVTHLKDSRIIPCNQHERQLMRPHD